MPGKPRETKSSRIRALLAEGVPSAQVAKTVGVSAAHINSLRWRDRNPGYQAEWMRQARKDPGYAERERAQLRRRYRDDVAYRKSRIAYAAAVRRKRREEARP